MPFATFGRAFGLAFFLAFGAVTTALAHALPGSLLIFSQDDDALKLSISLPLEDLILAAPELDTLTAAPLDQPFRIDSLSPLADYFSDHLSVQQASIDLTVTLIGGSTQTAFNEHVGAYVLLTLQFDVDLPNASSVFQMTLIYDAVMHEVRNHRATVYWRTANTEPVGLADFGYKPVNGMQSPVLLREP